MRERDKESHCDCAKQKDKRGGRARGGERERVRGITSEGGRQCDSERERQRVRERARERETMSVSGDEGGT